VRQIRAKIFLQKISLTTERNSQKCQVKEDHFQKE